MNIETTKKCVVLLLTRIFIAEIEINIFVGFHKKFCEWTNSLQYGMIFFIITSGDSSNGNIAAQILLIFIFSKS